MRARFPRHTRDTTSPGVTSRVGFSATVAVAALTLALTGAGAAAAGAVDAQPPIGGPQLGPGRAVNLAPGIKALPKSTQAKSWLVADLDTGNVLAAFNAHVQHAPASTIKTLAALALIPRVGPAVQVPFTAAELALTTQKDGVSTRVGLQVGHTYPAKRLFEAMLALSANDAAEALSAAAPGGRAAVLDAMNGIATSLQALDTHAATPDGLPAPGQLESAYDEALIVRAALQVKNFSAYDTTKTVSIPGRPPFGGLNHDRLQRSYHGVIGGKDGYTVASGQVWWGAARRYGHRLVVVVMDAGYAPVTQEIDLLNWGFAVDGKIAPVGTLVGPVTASGQPATVNDVASGKTPGSVAATPAKRVAVIKSSDSGPWRWVLGALILVAAVILGRRHLRAAGPEHSVDPISRPPAHADVSVAEVPVAEVPVTEVPVAEVPVAEVPVAEVPVAEVPVAEVPVAEVPVAEVPVAEVPVAEAPAADGSAGSGESAPPPVAPPPLGFAPILGTTVLPDHRAAAILTTIPLSQPPAVHVHVRPAVEASQAGSAVFPQEQEQPAPPSTPAIHPLEHPLARRVTVTELRPEDTRPTAIDELEVIGPATAAAVLEAQHARLRTGSVKIVPRP